MFLRRNFGPDRRRRKRQLLNTSVRILTESGPLDALGINVSDVGMSLFTIANLEMDSRIQIELLMPQSTERVRIWGTVRHRALYSVWNRILVRLRSRFEIPPGRMINFHRQKPKAQPGNLQPIRIPSKQGLNGVAGS